MKIAVKICTPNKDCRNGGDGPFAERLCTAFMQFGHTAVINFRDEWYVNNSQYDVVIFLGGLVQYRPDNRNFNIMWNISHPEVRTPEELNSYNIVFIASEPFCETVKGDITSPCYSLFQASDERLFYPRDVEKKYYLLFVGNNYYDKLKYRKIIEDLQLTAYADKCHYVGAGWHGLVPSNRIIADQVEYVDLPELYSSAKIVLNDHHGLMKQHGFINNRTYDLALLKIFQISDDVPGLRQYGIVTYNDSPDLEKKIEFYLKHEQAKTRNSELVYDRLKENTFTERCREMLGIFKSHTQ